ncbi:short-chain dehydrogenase [Paenibacillus sp. ATY16]|uniref:short-chain dehydrogenase n=1 Tax=Paenibacillus sp. ATY16 TaxID=1759312 RepID=UPI00200FEFD4|nr:short-chain dehydrogenase [Paenibacillus sp. ATY16]MCK9858198.1 short-chain dehydrogenase [Paenibacillus sp. ATY16]
MKMKPAVRESLKDQKISNTWNTDVRMDEALTIIENKDLIEGFYRSNGKKTTKSDRTTTGVQETLEYLADYILETENLTTKKNEYNILDAKRMQEVELFEEGLPSYSNDDEDKAAEALLTNALINNERIIKYEDSVYLMLKSDYKLLNQGATIDDLWCYQIVQNEDARNLIEGCYDLIQYYVKQGSSKIVKGKIKVLLFEDIGAIVRSYTKLELVQRRTGVKVNKKQGNGLEVEVLGSGHHLLFRMIVADKESITRPIQIIPFVDLEALIEKGIEDGTLNQGDIAMIDLLRYHYKGDLIETLKAVGNFKTNKRRFERLIKKLERIY